MNEKFKTPIFITAAVASLMLAYFTAPKVMDPALQGSKMGQALFESFDPSEATGIEIIEFDDEEETVTIEEDGTGDLITGYQEDMFLE